jgi:nucleoside-diphosphate-sugar epimerase
MSPLYLVTGGTGFIGSALVKALLRSGARVRTLDNDSRGHARKLGDFVAHVERLTGDIRDPEAVSRAVQGVDGVCHLAYINGTEFFYSKPELILEVAVKGMVNVLDACREHRVRQLALASSSEVYQTPPRVPTDEEVPLIVPDLRNPRYSYGGGKIISELLAINYGRSHFERVVIFRPHNVYGPDMGWEHVIPQFAVRMQERCAAHRSGRVPFPIQGNGQETRAFIYIDDAAQAILRVIDRGAHLNVYNVGTQNEVTVAALVQHVAHYFGREVEVVPGPLQPGSTRRRCPDVTKLRALGWEPQVSFEKGLDATLTWYAAHPNPNQAARAA